MTLVNKDLAAIWGRKGIRSLLMMLPVMLMILIPGVYFVAIHLLVTEQGPQLPEAIMQLLPASMASATPQAAWTAAFSNLVCPLLFLCVPLLCGAASSACVFMGEKEGGTLETLLLSSMGAKTIFNAKITCCSLLTVVISVISFLAFGITASVADILIGAPFFFNLEWLVLLVLDIPFAALFSVIFISAIITRVHSMGEALQTMGYLILPFVALFLMQFTGILRINMLFLMILAVLLAVLSFVAFNKSAGKFQAETLLTRAVEE